MKDYKSFLINVCDIENVTVKELMALTGKSQSVVYGWMNYFKPDFPTIESLGKILFRLGMSFDDFINYKHPIYDDGNATRVCYRYVDGYPEQSYIKSEILAENDPDKVIKTYLHDRMCLNKMITDFVNGLEIDTVRFNFLCKSLMPVLISDVDTISDAGTAIYDLNSQILNSYKLGLEIVKEIEENNQDDPNFEMPNHYIHFPDAHEVILLAADKNLAFVNEYLRVIDEREKVFLVDTYMKIHKNNPNYDKKNKIIKRLLGNDCVCYELKDKDIQEKYCELMKKILGV